METGIQNCWRPLWSSTTSCDMCRVRVCIVTPLWLYTLAYKTGGAGADRASAMSNGARTADALNRLRCGAICGPNY